MNDERRKLVIRAVAGDKEALGSLLEVVGPEIEAGLTIGPLWQGVLDAADVMQVTYLEVFLQIRHFDPSMPDAFPVWLNRIAENNLRDALRSLEAKKNPSPRNQLDAYGGDTSITLFNVLTAGVGSPSQAVRREEADGLLRRALRCIPPHYARAVELYDLEGQSVEQTAAALKRSVGAVYMLRSRAHDKLRDLLGPPSRILESRP